MHGQHGGLRFIHDQAGAGREPLGGHGRVAVRREGGSDVLGSPGMFSWNGAYGTSMWVDPKEELAVVFMASTPGLVRQHYRRVMNALVYGAIVD